MYKRTALALCVMMAISGCNSDDTNVNSPVSLKNIVYGGADNKAPAELNIKDTMMMQMRNLFDRIKNENDFTKLTMDLGDGSPVAVLSTTTGDKFLPGKLALGLSYVLIDMKKKGNANYKDYLAAYQRITKAMIVPMQPTDPTKYLYFNTSFGEYYFLLALNKFKDAGMLDEVFNDTETIAALKARLNFCDMFGSDASGSTNTCPQSGTPINIDSLNTAKNYYGVAYGIAGLRQRLGWNNPSFSSATDSSIANMTARDALLRKLISHYRDNSTEGFSDEAGNSTSTSYIDYSRYDRYSALLIAEVVQRSLEMGNEAGITDELKGYLRKSVDLILPQLNIDGKGFNYGRSIGPYGDSAFMEILTAAANTGILTEQEKNIAYAFIYKVSHRYASFWYDPTLPTPSINMWVKGRGTDAYRGKARALGENFSMLHQHLYVSNWWDKLGFEYKTPMSDSAFQSWLDSTQPRVKLTWHDTAHPYNAALVTVRDKKRVLNLNLSQAPDYNHFTPYFAVPFADNLIYGTTDKSYPLLVPQVSYNGKNYLPVTYYQNLSVQDAAGIVTVTFDTTKFRLNSKNPASSTDLDVKTHTVIKFVNGAITRTDTLSSPTLTGNATVMTDFTSFATLKNTAVGSDGYSVTYGNSDVTGYQVSGFNSCALSDFSTTSAGTQNADSTTPIGQLNSKFSCTTNPFPLSQSGSKFSWTVKYKDLP